MTRKTRRDEVLQTMRDEIAKMGGTIDEIRQSKGAHRVIYWRIGETTFATVVARTNGDWRQLRNAVTTLRQTVRAKTA